MSYLYVSEQGASIGISENRFQVKYKDGLIKSVPAEPMEVISVFGKVQITTQCMEECLKRGVDILFYSINGAYYGRLISTSHVNVQRQRKQAEIGKNEDSGRTRRKWWPAALPTSATWWSRMNLTPAAASS